ncbi:phosphoglycerate kinase [Desulfohalovibrio reitneri]|uniref:phosphoglycerate kinase n=1 Tax=Desulfohalovibrio reitneri TaxID=1307759 RepID=UPI0004A70588|nr:phosphoglycerate kinase [Desulfohalovibrio reitneri]
MLFIDEMDIAGKKLLIRVDYNVPIKGGVIQDDNRIVQSLDTLRHALKQGAALILCSHMGKPKGKAVPELSLKPVAGHLGDLLNTEVLMAPDCVGDEVADMASKLQPGRILLLENLRFHEGETANAPGFSKALASLAEVYVDDAFGTAHRAHASNVGVTQFMDRCCGGLLLKKEWQYLGEALQNPEHPYVAVSGGAKVSTKLEVLQNLLDTVDELIIGGAMSNTFFLAQGYETGSSLVERDLVDAAKGILERAEAKGVKVHLPVDVVLGESVEDENPGEAVDASAIPDGKMALDIGPKTIEKFQSVLGKAKTVMWNGPMGVFENPAFAKGSLALAEAMAKLEGATTVVGGGDTDVVVHKAGLADRFSFISTGGGSFLEFLEGKELPAFKALRECSQ